MSTEKQGITISRRNLTIIVIAVLFLIAGGITLGLNWNKWFGDEPAVTKTEPDIDPNAQKWQGQQPKDKGGEATGIKIPGYPSITLPANQKKVSVALLNPEGNPCYFKFELVLKDGEETLYTSKLVPPGQAIYEVELDRPLEKGEYAATIKISTTSVEDGSAMNGANVETELIVQ